MKAVKSAVFSSLMTGFSAASLGIAGLNMTGLGMTGLGITASLGAALGSAQPAAAASSFSEQAVNQSSFMVMAAPRANNAYNLVILEQVSNKRACWQTNNDAAGTLTPLLLDFDFTGICGRSTDSNGYSVRMGGQDLALQYSLRLVGRGDYIALVGTPTVRGLPALEIGRTKSSVSHYLAVTLNPGWQLTRRAFEGKAIGHTYLSNPTSIQTYIAAQPPVSTPPTRPAVPPVTSPAKPPVATPVPPIAQVPAPPTTLASNPHYASLNALYQEVMGRPVDASGLETYGRKLDKGHSLNSIRRDLQNSTEGRRFAINRIYQEVLRRNADEGGLNLYVRRMAGGWSLNRVRQEISKSDEARSLGAARP